MHARLIITTLLLIIAPVGCKSQGQLDLAERDMRLQENRIYKLQNYVEQYQQMLEACQAENEELRAQLAGKGQVPRTTPLKNDKPRTLRDLMRSGSPGTSAPSGPALNAPALPDIDLGKEVDPATIQPPANPPTDNDVPEPPGFDPPGAASTLQEPDDIPTPPTQPAQARGLFIRAVGASKEESSPAGLLVVIEPRSAAGGLARPPLGATMSLMIVAGPQEQELGRWVYTAEQTTAAFRAGFGAASAWRFVIPFQHTATTPPKLKLYARLSTPSGEKMLAEREFSRDQGASIEELPAGDAGWSRARPPVAAIPRGTPKAPARTARLSLREMFTGRSSTGSSAGSSHGGNQAPAWQLQPLQQPAGNNPAGNSRGGNMAPAYVPPAAAAQTWDPARAAAAPLESGQIPTTPLSEEAPSKANETAGRPTWTPYR